MPLSTENVHTFVHNYYLLYIQLLIILSIVIHEQIMEDDSSSNWEDNQTYSVADTILV